MKADDQPCRGLLFPVFVVAAADRERIVLRGIHLGVDVVLRGTRWRQPANEVAARWVLADLLVRGARPEELATERIMESIPDFARLAARGHGVSIPPVWP